MIKKSKTEIMKRVDTFIDVDGQKRGWNEIENLYFESISFGSPGYKSPQYRLNSLLADYPIDTAEHIILRYLLINFERIIKAKPDKLHRVIETLNKRSYNDLIYVKENKELTGFGKKLEKAFRYQDFRNNKLVELSEWLNIKVCLYCNSQYTLVVRNQSRIIANFQFDHFFPKNKYPYLGISLYNLIPSCASCNLHKSGKEWNLEQLTHPYYENFHELFEFTLKTKKQLRLLNGETVPDAEINIQLTNHENPKVKEYEHVFSLTGTYNRHKDIAKEIFKKAHAYNNGGMEALLALKSKDGRQLFSGKEEIQALLLANYPLTDDINKRPLSKFMSDMGKQSGLIQD